MFRNILPSTKKINRKPLPRATGGRTVNDETDDVLFRKFLTGDDRAYRELYGRYAPRLLFSIEKLVRSSDDAEDLFQIVWVKVFHMRDRGVPPGNFELYLFRMARNEALTFLRKKKDESLEERHDPGTTYHAGSPLEATELEDFLEEALGQLPVGMREVVVLKEYDDMAFAQIAQIIGITETLARVRYHRAKHLLRETIVRRLRLTEGEIPSEFI